MGTISGVVYLAAARDGLMLYGSILPNLAIRSQFETEQF
jgi:hypothetical protein